ncbi:hypothetical protein [Thermoplasma sp.]|uniref:hypothetical protein n=1 Tax=Thermoplasma sp. TaxID=1973142 RepID=UPI001287EF69|nr:hypothetical protein [Thermoplasma sp.]KAA8922239.1 MAG: hypothetical protein F6Q11_05420 [Thermoplasma sp.]
MGRSTPSTRQSLDILISGMEEMKKVMRTRDAEILQDLIKLGRMHAAEISYAGIDVELGFLISVLIEVVKRTSMPGDRTG